MQNNNQIQVRQNNSVSEVKLTEPEQLMVNIATNYCALFNDYNENNAKRLALQFANKLVNVKTKTGQPAYSVCTRDSIQQAFFEVLDKNIDLSKSQGALICYGNKLSLQLEYFGNVMTAKETIPNLVDIRGTIIYKGDEIEISVNNGLYKIEKHKTNFSNMRPENIIGAYSIAIYKDENGKEYQGEVEVMNADELKAAWLQSSNGTAVHAKFGHEMARKTVESRNAKHLLNKSSNTKFNFNIEDEAETPTQDENVIDVANIINEETNKTNIDNVLTNENSNENIIDPTLNSEMYSENNYSNNNYVASEPTQTDFSENQQPQEKNIYETLNTLGDTFNFQNKQQTYQETYQQNYKEQPTMESQQDDKIIVNYSEWLQQYKPTGQWKIAKYDNQTKKATIVRIA